MLRRAATAFALSALLTLPACNRRKSCTSEIADGPSLYHASASGTEDEAELTQRATKLACARMCVTKAADKKAACETRCGADAAAGKLRVKSTCKPIPAQ